MTGFIGGRPLPSPRLVFAVDTAASGLAGDGGLVEVLSSVGGDIALRGGVTVEGALEVCSVRVGVGEFVAGDVVLGVSVGGVAVVLVHGLFAGFAGCVVRFGVLRGHWVPFSSGADRS